MSVILFHAGIGAFSGGYIGVDVFFVISGYLITTLIYKEIGKGSFTFAGFYKRRAARLLPALSITLFTVLLFGFIFYNNTAFDNLGKEIFFSSFGAANILFSKGVNYFVKDQAYQPLIHLWSLGIEEQFYVVWPALLLLFHRLSRKNIIPLAIILFALSLWLSVLAVENGLPQGYFLPQYRAFELLAGVILSLLLNGSFKDKLKFSDMSRRFLSAIGLALIIIPMLALDEQSNFPGFNALWPCVGTTLIIGFPNKGIITKTLSNKALVLLGLISYPLYLYHQPVITFIHFFEWHISPIEVFALVILVTVPMAWLTYRYIEKPVRKIAHSSRRKASFAVTAGLVFTIPLFAFTGIGIAKSNGFEERFRYLNPFALEISKAQATTFHGTFERGYQVKDGLKGKALFVGDSVLQQYVLPTVTAMGLEIEDVDTVSRGGCVLLKGVEFEDQFADISCNKLREMLYSNTKKYDYVIVSQAWNAYDSSVLNFPDAPDGYEKWLPFLDQTIEHFSKLAGHIVIFGGHPVVNGTLKLQPSIVVNKPEFKTFLSQLYIENVDALEASHAFFSEFEKRAGVQVVEPYYIFCNGECVTNDGNWSYFSDNQHVTAAATPFIAKRLAEFFDR